MCKKRRKRAPMTRMASLYADISADEWYSDVFLIADEVRRVATPNASNMMRDMSSSLDPIERISGTYVRCVAANPIGVGRNDVGLACARTSLIFVWIPGCDVARSAPACFLALSVIVRHISSSAVTLSLMMLSYALCLSCALGPFGLIAMLLSLYPEKLFLL